MTVPDELAWLDALRRVLGRAHLWRPEEIAETVADKIGLGITVALYETTEAAAET
jgi:hypothetical protein